MARSPQISKCLLIVDFYPLITLLRLSKWHLKPFRRSRRLLFSTHTRTKNQEIYDPTFNISSPNNLSWTKAIYSSTTFYLFETIPRFCSAPKKQCKDCRSNGTECGWLAQTYQMSTDSSQDMPQQLHGRYRRRVRRKTCDEKGWEMVGIDCGGVSKKRDVELDWVENGHQKKKTFSLTKKWAPNS